MVMVPLMRRPRGMLVCWGRQGYIERMRAESEAD